MPIPTHEPVWWGSLLWLLGIAAASFGVAWLSGTRLRIKRPVYVALLLGVTLGLAAGYVAWLGVGVTDVLTARWGWGLLAAALAPVLLAWPVSHQPVTRHVRGRRLAWEMIYEGGVYGAAEGVLLSALPPFVTWQMVHALGWSGAGGAIARWALPIGAGAAVAVIHHLGYWNYRNKILLPISLGLSALSVAFLVTASWIAPALGHVLMHWELTIQGSEMPPQERPVRAEVSEPPRLAEAA
ncbi:MAG TPA: hypothetical protein VFH58_11515 [Acidimicrobiales bacterium]|nr:hypothetical protein [Acidimicrobiales bacterium]